MQTASVYTKQIERDVQLTAADPTEVIIHRVYSDGLKGRDNGKLPCCGQCNDNDSLYVVVRNLLVVSRIEEEEKDNFKQGKASVSDCVVE